MNGDTLTFEEAQSPDTSTFEELQGPESLTFEQAQEIPPVVREAEPGSLQAHHLVPAVRKIGGELAIGEPGDTHPEIINREGIPAVDIDQRGFFAPPGVFLDRESAAQATQLPTEMEPGRLHSTDLIQVQNQFPSTARIKSPDEVGRIPSGELSTTYGGPRNPLASYAETMESVRSGAETPAMAFVAPRPVISEPRIELPKVPIDKEAGFIESGASEVINQLEGVPEFFTSDLGIVSALSAKLSPRLTSLGFSADLTYSAFEQAKNLYKNWSTMTPGQKGKATADLIVTTVFGGLTAKHAATPSKVTPTRFEPKPETIPGMPELPKEPVPPKPAPEAPPVEAKPAPAKTAIEDFTEALEEPGFQRAKTDKYKVGLSVKSIDDLEALAQLRDKYSVPEEGPRTPETAMLGMQRAAQGQLAREAIESAISFGSQDELTSVKKLGERPLDWRKNPEVAKWIVDNAERMGWEKNPSLPEVKEFVAKIEAPKAAILTPKEFASRELGVTTPEEISALTEEQAMALARAKYPEGNKRAGEIRGLQRDGIIYGSKLPVDELPKIDALRKSVPYGAKQVYYNAVAEGIRGSNNLPGVRATYDAMVKSGDVKPPAPDAPKPEDVVPKWTIGQVDGKWAVFRDGKQFGDVFSATENGKEMAQFVADAATRGAIESVNNARDFIKTRVKEKGDIHRTEIEKSKAPPPEGYVLEGDRYVYRGAAPKPVEPAPAPAPARQKTPEVIAAEEASQSAFEKLGAAEKGAYDKSKRKGMTKPMLARLAEFDKLVEAERAAKAAARAAKGPSPATEATVAQPELVGMGAAEKGEAAPGAQIEQLTQALQNVRESRAPLSEQVKEAFSIGDRFSATKDTLGRAISGLKTTGDLIIKKWQGVPNIDDLLRAKKSLSKAIESRGWRLQQWEKAAYRAVPNPRDQAAIAKWVDAGGDRAELQRGLAEAPAKYKRAYQDALNLSGDKLTAAQNVQNYFESRLQEAIDAGVLDHGIENYLHRIYENKPSLLKRALAYTQTGLLNKNPALAKKRFFQFDWEAEKAGFTPVQSFIKRITAYEASLSKAIAAREFIKSASEMKAADGRPIVDIKGVGIPVEDEAGVREGTLIKPKFNPAKNNEPTLPNGDPNPNYRGDYVNRDYRALSRWKWAGTDAGGKPIFVQGDVAIHPDYVGRVDALLKPSQVRFGKFGAVLRPALGVSSTIKQTMLDLSGFHPVQITVHGLEHRVLPWKIIQDIDLSHPDVDGLLQGGVTLGGDYSGIHREGLVGASLTRKVPWLGPVMESYHQWLFQSYIPRIKMTMALHALERNRARYAGRLTDEQIFHKTASEANAAFGELNYTVLERSKTAQDMARLILLAPDFLEARGRFAAQAFQRGGKMFGNEQRTALLLGALTMWVTARIANKMVDDQYHFEPENMFNIVKDGHSYGLRTVQGDILHLLTKPMQFTMSRLNPVYARTLLEALTGRDYFGRKRSPAEQVWDAASTTIPISLRSNRERTIWESLANAFGVTARRYSDVDDAFKLAQKWKDTHAVPERGEFIYDPNKDVLRPLKLALNHGDEDVAAVEIKKLIDSKVYNIKKLDEYFKRFASMPFTGSKANDKKFVTSLTEDQRKTVEAARQHKNEIRKLYMKSRSQYLAPASTL